MERIPWHPGERADLLLPLLLAHLFPHSPLLFFYKERTSEYGDLDLVIFYINFCSALWTDWQLVQGQDPTGIKHPPVLTVTPPAQPTFGVGCGRRCSSAGGTWWAEKRGGGILQWLFPGFINLLWHTAQNSSPICILRSRRQKCCKGCCGIQELN